MHVSSCPTCGGLVSVPGELPQDAQVECPLCQARFQVGQFTASPAPQLVILDPTGVPMSTPSELPAGSESTFGSDLMPPQDAEGFQSTDAFPATDGFQSTNGQETGTTAEADSEEAAPAFDFLSGQSEAGESVEIVADSDSATESTVVVDSPLGQQDGGVDLGEESQEASSGSLLSQRTTRRRPQKNMALEMVKIVGGGIGGCVCAVFIMWWAIGTDPLKLAPKVPSAMAFIVPAKLRGDAPPAPAPEADPSQNNKKKPKPRKTGSGLIGDDDNRFNGPLAGDDKPKNGKNKPKNGKNNPDQNNPPAGGPDLPGEELDLDPTLPGVPTTPEENPFGQPETIDLDPTEENPFGDPDFDTKPEPKPPTEVAVAPQPEPPPATPPRDPRRLKKATSAELGEQLIPVLAAVSRFESTLSRTEELTIEQRRGRALDAYGRFCALGDVLTRLDMTQKGLSGRLQNVEDTKKQLMSDPAGRDLMGNLAARHLSLETRPYEGIVLAGKVLEIAPLETLPSMKVQLAGKTKRVVTVVSPADPSDRFEPQQDVMVFGRIVEEPAKNLPGYTGSESLVIWRTYPAPKPKVE